MSFHVLLQGILPTRGLKLSLLHWQVGSLPLSHLGSPNYSITYPVALSVIRGLCTPIPAQSSVGQAYCHPPRTLSQGWGEC